MPVSETKPTDDVTRVFFLIENRLVRETLVRLFRKRSDLCVVGQGCSLEAIDTLDSQCDILVLDDLQMLSPVGARLHDEPGAKCTLGIVLIGMEADEEQFFLAVRAGVSGYLLSDASASDVVTAIRAVARGEAVCPPRLCRTLFHAVARYSRETTLQAKQDSLPGLTIHQQQIIGLVARGMTNKEIASQLNLSEFTIKNHVHRIMKQVDAVNRSEAVRTVRACGYPLIV
jgi:DNA-binding NarL/FixJ family response regulator